MDNKNKNLTYDIIIPFMYNGDRYPLFEATIKCLHKHFKDNDRVNIIIHETSPKRYLTDEFIREYNIKYMFSEWNEIFHRAWALNVPVKYIAEGDVYVFMDADLIITQEWVDELLLCNDIMVGWGKMLNLTKRATEHYIKTGEILNDISRIRIPQPHGAAGGINIIPKQIFFEIGGWDETFRGTYGGEDNALNCKLQALGYIKLNVNTLKNCFKSTVYHLHHAHRTPRRSDILTIYSGIKQLTKNDWLNKIKVNNWGKRSRIMYIDIKNDETTIYSNIDNGMYKMNKNDKLNVLWCKLDMSNRVLTHIDNLLGELDKLVNLTLIERIIDIAPGIYQQQVWYNGMKQERLLPHNVNNYDCIIVDHSFAFKDEDWDNVNIPIFMIYEDQHATAKKQLEFAIKMKWIILYRYQLKPFNNDINHLVHKHYWLPHSVNIDMFKDYGLKKEYVLLQTGALGNIYELRQYVDSYFKRCKYDGYKRIKRPNEYINGKKFSNEKKWPLGADYAKELNKAWFSLCCGGKVRYPVMKYFEIPACDSIIYSEYFDELGDLGFIPDENMIVVDKSDIIGQLDYLMEDKDNLKRLIQNGKDLIHSRHTTKIRAKELVDIIKGELNNEH